MPGMSPRMKMRRGRFGLGGFKGPTLLLSVGSPFGWFVATAADDLDGDVSANVQWFFAGPGSPGCITLVRKTDLASGSPWCFGSPYPVQIGSGSPFLENLAMAIPIGAKVNLTALIDIGSPQSGPHGSPGLIFGSPFVRGAGSIGGGNQVIVATVVDSGGKRNVTTLTLTGNEWTRP